MARPVGLPSVARWVRGPVGGYDTRGATYVGLFPCALAIWHVPGKEPNERPLTFAFLLVRAYLGWWATGFEPATDTHLTRCFTRKAAQRAGYEQVSAARSCAQPANERQARELVGLSQYAGSAGSSVLVAPIRAAAESCPRLIGTMAVAAANP
jgi:hypothetical protein